MFRQEWTLDEAAEILGVSKGRVQRWIDVEGVVTPKIIMRSRYLDRKALVRLSLLIELQGMFGEKAPISFHIVSHLTDDVIASFDRLDLEEGAAPGVVFKMNGGAVTINCDTLKRLQERIRAVALV